MIHTPMVLQAYTPQIHLGDWQIVVFVNRRRNRISVERWHSSEKAFHPMESGGQMLRIDTGIRAFRRQMPVLAMALEKIAVADKSDAQIIDDVFRVLAAVYSVAPASERVAVGEDPLPADDFAEFLEHRKHAALMALEVVVH
jgi:hypothetical protein